MRLGMAKRRPVILCEPATADAMWHRMWLTGQVSDKSPDRASFGLVVYLETAMEDQAGDPRT